MLSIDYDDGTCQYAYIDLYELTNHPDQDPANSGQDWDLIAVGNATRPDVLLTITNQLTGEVLFEGPETGDIDPSSTPSGLLHIKSNYSIIITNGHYTIMMLVVLN